MRAARANLVVRDRFASFSFHPCLDLSYLKETVEGIEAAGYRALQDLIAYRCDTSMEMPRAAQRIS